MIGYEIRNREQLSVAYLLLRWAKERNTERDMVEAKRAIRTFNRKPVSERRIIRSDFDGAVVLLPLPEFVKDEESANKWFVENEYKRYRPSMYDCTGQPFTSWYKLFRRNGKFWAYHGISMDV